MALPFSSRLVLALLLPLLSACVAPTERGPQRLIEGPTATGGRPQVGAVTPAGGETRPALLASAAFAVRLPARPLLTYGFGVAWAGAGEAPGWFRLALKADGRVIDTRTLNPRVARGWRDVSLELPDLQGQVVLDFELRLTDRDGHDVPRPAELLLAVAEPTLHDRDAYGQAPGIILISIDTLRRDHVGAYGYERPTTPALDDLARRGILAQDAVSVSSWTLPAHLSLLTSVDPGRHGGMDMHSGFNRRVPTLPALLRDKGFATHAVTSHLYVSPVYGFDEGFEHVDFRQDRKADKTAARAIALLDRLGDRPFFLFLHFYDPHWHYDPPAYARELFDTGYDGPLSGLWRDFKDRDASNTRPEDLAHLLALYDGEIRFTDDQVGRILAHLRARGLQRSTLVLVTSDHGEEFLEHGSWEHQKTLYDEVVRVPLILAGPDIAPRHEPAQATLLDVAPTVLEWAGLAVPSSMQGRSLLHPLDHREAYGETDHVAGRRSRLFLRSGHGRWKAIFTLTPGGAGIEREEWYDLSVDPDEQRSAPPRDAVAAAVRERGLARWRDSRADAGARQDVHLTKEQIEELRALGYVNP